MSVEQPAGGGVTVSRFEARDVSALPLTDPAATTGLLEVFRRRYLLKLLVRRELSSRYGGTVLGLAWSYITPAIRFCMYLFIFTLVLGRGHGLENFAIHLFAGMVVVNFFTETFNAGTKSIMSNKALIKKMAVPKEMFPVSSMLVSLYHTFPQMVVLVGVCIFTGWSPDLTGLVAAVMGFGIVLFLGLALGLFFSALNVYYQDFGRLVSTFTMFVNFMVPMMYPYSFVKEQFGAFAHLYLLNPVAEAVLLMQRGFWVTTTSDPAKEIPLSFPDDLMVRGAIMLVASIVLLYLAQKAFTRMEGRIPETLT